MVGRLNWKVSRECVINYSRLALAVGKSSRVPRFSLCMIRVSPHTDIGADEPEEFGRMTPHHWLGHRRCSQRRWHATHLPGEGPKVSRFPSPFPPASTYFILYPSASDHHQHPLMSYSSCHSIVLMIVNIRQALRTGPVLDTTTEMVPCTMTDLSHALDRDLPPTLPRIAIHGL
jgi:hypothetical protein